MGTHRFIGFICFVSLALTACSSVEERQERVKNLWGTLWGSGGDLTQEYVQRIRSGMEGAVEVGKSLIEGVEQTVEDVNARVEKVREGVEKVEEGKHLIEEGVGGG